MSKPKTKPDPAAPELRGNEPAVETPAVETPEAEAEAEQLPMFLTAYLEAYPDETEFLVTSDGNVFLAQGRGDALNHARSLGTELKTYRA